MRATTPGAASQARGGAPSAGDHSAIRRVARQLRKTPVRILAALVVLVVLLMAAFAAQIAAQDPTRMRFGHFLEPPGPQHILGTDEAGRDVFSRVVHGARVSIIVGVLSVALGAVIGVSLGLLAGYYRGSLDAFVVWLIDVLLAFPGILLALLIAAALGAGLGPIVIAIGVFSVPTFARLTRGSALSARQREYVEAARAAGASDPRILVKHVLLNSFGPILVYATLVIGRAILTEASLSFLGIGVPPPTPAWGSMVSAGQNYMRGAPHVVLFPGIAIVVTVLAFNILGDALRDALDPKTAL
jgi:peptide/nickel transport system permease protein